MTSRFVVAAPAIFGVLLLVSACGYRSRYAGAANERLAVEGRTRIADATVLAEAEAGARGELARAGVLRGGHGWPRLVVEIVRTDHESAGVASRGDAPVARGTRISIIGRAFIEREQGSTLERASLELRIDEFITVNPRAPGESSRRDDALRAAARRLGEQLARGILGESGPAPGM